MTNAEIIDDVIPGLEAKDSILYVEVCMMLELARMDQLKLSHDSSMKIVDTVFNSGDI